LQTNDKEVEQLYLNRTLNEKQRQLSLTYKNYQLDRDEILRRSKRSGTIRPIPWQIYGHWTTFMTCWS